MIYIVGIGPGHKDYILPKATNIIKQSNFVLGFKRALDSLDIKKSQKVYMKKLSDLDKYILEENNEDITVSIVASGDPTFYGITNYIKKRAKVYFKVIPGISSFQYLTSKVILPWNDAYLGSLHGRNEEFIEKVNNHKLSIWLTDKENNPAFLCGVLEKENIECRVIIGENLSYDDEKISEGNPKKFSKDEFSDLSIFIVDRN